MLNPRRSFPMVQGTERGKRSWQQLPVGFPVSLGMVFGIAWSTRIISSWSSLITFMRHYCWVMQMLIVSLIYSILYLYLNSCSERHLLEPCGAAAWSTRNWKNIIMSSTCTKVIHPFIPSARVVSSIIYANSNSNSTDTPIRNFWKLIRTPCFPAGSRNQEN